MLEAPEYRAQAIVKEAHGSVELPPLLERYVRSSHAFRASDLVGNLKEVANKPFYFAYETELSSCEFEPDFLCSCRMQIKGTGSVIMVAAERMRNFLKSIVGAKDQATAGSKASMIEYLQQGLTEEKLKALSDANVGVSHATVNDGSVYVTPPGYVVMYSPSNSSRVTGIRSSFVLHSGAEDPNLKAVMQMLPVDEGVSGQGKFLAEALKMLRPKAGGHASMMAAGL